MKRIFLLLIFAVTMNSIAQTSWSQFDKLMNEGSYKSAYALAEGVYKKSTASAERLAAAYHMTVAAVAYQEDVHDSAEARYRALLPQLEPLEKALCHAFLGEYDSALAYSEVLKQTPVERIKQYCEGGKGENMTPTAYDIIVLQAQDRGSYNPQQRVDLQRQLVAFHAADADDLRLWHELRLLDLLENVPNHPLKVEQVKDLLDRYRDSKSDAVTKLYCRLAQYYIGKEDYVTALRYCDTAVARAPKSEGGVDCANIRSEILQKRVTVDNDGLVMAPGAPSLQRVRYRNLDHLWWRIIPYTDDYRWGDKTKASLRAAKPLESGEWKVESGKDYKYAESYVSLPALKAGKWLLLVSPGRDFKADGFMAYEVNVTDMYLVQNGQEGLLLDRRTGKPIVGQELLLKKVDYRNTTLLERTRTDGNGRYRFSTKEYHYNYKIVITRDGYTLDASYGRSFSQPDSTMKMWARMVTDRPIYKPGDTMQVAAVVYRSNGFDAQVAANEQVELLFNDPNGQGVDKKTLTTDDFGVAHVAFAVPTDRVAGRFWLEIRSVTQNKSLQVEAVRVEEYKQPKFMVSLGSEVGSRSAEFGKPYTVQGLAASYSAVPVSGARVQYTVTREMMHRYWWRYWSYRYDVAEVASGELTTAADGSFNIVFTPEPDSSVELSTKPCFVYTVNAIVTDLNGESHEAETRVRVGYTNAFLSLEAGSTIDNLKVRHFDLNGNKLPGKVDVKIELLRQPQTPLLDSPLMNEEAHHTMTEADFRKAFPLLAYDKGYNDPDRWPVAYKVESEKWKGESGVYRVTLSAEGADTVVEYITHTAQDVRKVQSQKLLWAEIDKRKAEVGDKVTLRFGSRFKDVEVYYLLRVGDEERDFRRLTLNDELRSITVAVDSTMLGGFQIDLIVVREGIKETASYSVGVPFSHKELKVEIATFRDKLLPGENEEWTISVKNYELGVKSAMVMAMYDDALNSYESTDWGFSPWHTNNSSYMRHFVIGGGTGYWLEEYKHLYYNGAMPTVWTLKEALPYYNRWSRHMYRNAAMAKGSVVYEEEAVEVSTELAVVEDRVPSIEVGTAQSAAKMSADEAEEEAEAGFGSNDGGAQPEVQVRQNLNTLAFFAADVRTDSTGTATYRFTVPELLTRWNVKGLAVTKDLKIGTLDKTLVTSKPLMVQPNMPRFLRSGDSLSLMAKVVLNNEELGIRNEKLPVEVFFVLTDAATGDTLCHHTEEVMVKDAAQVMFDVEVPRNVYVATYKIVAIADGMSDGEQGQLPVVTNRQAVTLSQALYINGAGEKHFSMPEWLVNNGTREPQLVGAELTGNPVWLAIKCMPYLKTYENPSTLYLANQLYMNSKGRDILNAIKDLNDFNALQGTSSRLRMNEDVKQTLLQATPWVQDAQSEEEQMAAVANYFDRERLDAELKKASAELAGRQNADGGWSWMPEGESSLWVTQGVLQKVFSVQCSAFSDATQGGGSQLNTEHLTLNAEIERALAYVDREQQRHYDRYIKPYLKKDYKWEPTDIDYLYTRSFYGKANTEAYKFYYDNALKHYRGYENLYTQAQLALIFHRHGDRKAALDLLRRLKEKSLASDEMGLYWRDNRSSWLWYQRPVETQALLIQAFAEIAPDDRATIGQMQQWLLKQKQTTRWGNDRATTEAINALTVKTVKSDELRVKSGEGGSQLNTEHLTLNTDLTVFGTPMTAGATGLEGYRSQRWTAAALDSLRSHGNSDIVLTVKSEELGVKSGEGGSLTLNSSLLTVWGSVYYQFTDDMDRIPSSDMGITLKRTYSVVGSGQWAVGSKVKVRIDIQCDRAMEYLELVDGRPSCVEPISTRAGWRWNDGLGYYIVVTNTDTRCYIDRLEKGHYWFEYEVYVTNPGRFLSGPVTIQCMYAPEFRATAPAQTLEILTPGR